MRMEGKMICDVEKLFFGKERKIGHYDSSLSVQKFVKDLDRVGKVGNRRGSERAARLDLLTPIHLLCVHTKNLAHQQQQQQCDNTVHHTSQTSKAYGRYYCCLWIIRQTPTKHVERTSGIIVGAEGGGAKNYTKARHGIYTHSKGLGMKYSFLHSV